LEFFIDIKSFRSHCSPGVDSVSNRNEYQEHFLEIKVRRNASRHFRNKKKAYLKAKIEELETNGKVNNVRDLYRGINDFKKG